ncbi:acetyl-CoA carboxylase [Furfurilactobacillus milii]|uniref:Acetyl-CoA carboxylase n=1 Tax=Furfurilactobacillus milii TaxID=2888272 RepID=A0A6N9HZS5_9LACO|nr:acetyl-CoA carboxylase [Furfurilactobacillus milii]MYV16034.1 acetyl-CoA carboxylase [Furfurilactobacillus milii]
MKNDADTIIERIEPLFKRVPRTMYHIQCVNNKYDQVYNFFFITQPQHKRPHSIPLHSVHTYDLGYLETVIKAIKQRTQLSIEFTGFMGQRWPVAQKEIQFKKRWDED